MAGRTRWRSSGGSRRDRRRGAAGDGLETFLLNQEAFYGAVGQISFTLLGLWWAVVQFRHAEWMPDRATRVMAYAVALHFMLPGVMSILSLVAGDTRLIWRISFALAGGAGIVATALLTTNAVVRRTTGMRLIRLGQVLAIPLYALVTVVAILGEQVSRFGVTLAPLQLEGILLSIVVFLGVNLAWLLFTLPKTEAQAA